MDQKQNQPDESGPESPPEQSRSATTPYGCRRSLSAILESDEEVEILSTSRTSTSSASPPSMPASTPSMPASTIRHTAGNGSDSERPSSTTVPKPAQEGTTGSQPVPKRILHRRVQASREAAIFYQPCTEDDEPSSTMVQGDSEQSLFKHPGKVRLLKRDSAKKGDPKKGDPKKGDPKKGDPKKDDSRKKPMRL